MTTFRREILDELLAGASSREELMGEAGLFKQLKKAMMERVLGAELTHHLGYEKHDPPAGAAATAATAIRARGCWGRTGNSTCRFPVIGPGRSSPSWKPRARPVSTASTRRSSASTPEG